MISDYSECRVILAPSGELVLALPIYANQNGAIFEPEDLKDFGTKDNVSIGIYENFGYLLYHPEQEFSFYMQSLKLFEDLGKL